MRVPQTLGEWIGGVGAGAEDGGEELGLVRALSSYPSVDILLVEGARGLRLPDRAVDVLRRRKRDVVSLGRNLQAG